MKLFPALLMLLWFWTPVDGNSNIELTEDEPPQKTVQKKKKAKEAPSEYFFTTESAATKAFFFDKNKIPLFAEDKVVKSTETDTSSLVRPKVRRKPGTKTKTEEETAFSKKPAAASKTKDSSTALSKISGGGGIKIQQRKLETKTTFMDSGAKGGMPKMPGGSSSPGMPSGGSAPGMPAGGMPGMPSGGMPGMPAGGMPGMPAGGGMPPGMENLIPKDVQNMMKNLPGQKK